MSNSPNFIGRGGRGGKRSTARFLGSLRSEAEIPDLAEFTRLLGGDEVTEAAIREAFLGEPKPGQLVGVDGKPIEPPPRPPPPPPPPARFGWTPDGAWPLTGYDHRHDSHVHHQVGVYRHATGHAADVGSMPQEDLESMREAMMQRLPVEEKSPCDKPGRGHHFDPETVTYKDGLIAGHCARCGSRLEIPWLPGGTAALKVRFLAMKVIDGDENESTLAEFLGAVDKLEEDQRVIEDVLALVEDVKRVAASHL